jgi:hypothetical protein
MIFSTGVFAAKWSSPKENKPSFKYGFISSSLGENFQDQKDAKLTPINYVPNSTGRALLGVSYLGYGLSASFTGQQDNKSIVQRGKTTGQDYQFRFFKEQNTFDVFYQKYQGYYIGNSSELDPNTGGEKTYLQRPDIHSIHYGLQYFRSLNPEDFSMAACFDQEGWQNENGGSWFLYSGIDFHHLDADSSFIPSQLSTQYSSIQDFQKGDFSTLKVGVGGAFALVYSKFIFAAQLIIAGGQQAQSYTLNSMAINKTLPAGGGNLKISLGYNGEIFFSSFNLFNDSTTLKLDDKIITSNTQESTFIVGVHF